MTPLEEANRRLRELQAARRQQRIDEGLPVDVTLIDQGRRDHTAVPAIVQSLPDHLGWESDLVTRALRRSFTTQSPAVVMPSPPPAALPVAAKPTTIPKNLTVYPDLAAAILRERLDPPARAYHLLRLLDATGSGRFDVDGVRELLATDDSPWRVVSRRQLHNLLAAGEGVFWTVQDGRVWLLSPSKVAMRLGVAHLRGRAVSVPVQAFLGDIVDVRANLYAAFLSGRPNANMPIARATIRAYTGVKERSQKAYELRTKISADANFCVGERINSPDAQDQAWAHQGQGAFALKDRQGKQGEAGQTYLAWQLPNSYHGKHDQLPRGKQRRVNRELKVLLTKEAAGNGSSRTNHQRRYYPNGGQAARMHSRSREPVYWQRPPGSGVRVWHELR